MLASQVAQRLKHLPAMWETWVRSLGREDPLEEEVATHSSILAWEIPWTRSLAGYSPWGHKRVRPQGLTWPDHKAFGILAPQPETEPVLPALEAGS